MRVALRAWIFIGVGLCALFSALATSTAYADPLSKPASADARNHLSVGNKLYNVRSFNEAAAEYKAGALIESAPVFDYNLGQCFRQLGKYQDAIWHYERFLTRGNPQGELLAAVTGFIAQMKSELEKKAMTQKPIEPGPLQGSDPVQSSSLRVSEGTRRAESWYDDGFGWGLSGAGIVGLAIGSGFLINAISLNDQADANSSQQERTRLRDKASTRNLLGGAIGIGGAGLLVAGIVKFAIHEKPTHRTTGFNIAPSSNGVLVSVEF